MTDSQTVLVLASTFPRWAGDSDPRFIYDLCEHLDDRFNIIVLAPHCRGALTEETLGRSRVKRFRYAPESLEKLAYDGGIASKLGASPGYWLLVPCFIVAQIFAAVRLLRTEDVAVIHAHWLIPQGLIAIIANVIGGRRSRVLCTSHGTDLYGFQDFLSTRIKQFVLRHSDLVTVVSTPMVEKIKRLSPKASVKIIPMGVDLKTVFVPNPRIERNPEQVLFIGRLIEGKGLHCLVAAMPLIMERYPKTQLLIAGRGRNQKQLEAQINALGMAKNVLFLGNVTHDDLAHFLQTTGMVVLPFIAAEGLGLTLIEALGCEAPVIIGDVPAIHDVVQHKQHAVIVNPESKAVLANAVIALRDSPQKARQMARSGRQKMLQIYDWQVIGKRYSELLMDISGR